MVLNVCFCTGYSQKSFFCRKDYLFFGLKTDLVHLIFLNSFHNRYNDLFEFGFEIEYNQVAWFILEKKIAIICLGIRIIWQEISHNFPKQTQLAFFAHIKFLNWSYFITYGCGLDEISALEIIFNNLLLQHWGQILFEVEFDIVVPSRVSYNYCFKMAEFCPRSCWMTRYKAWQSVTLKF